MIEENISISIALITVTWNAEKYIMMFLNSLSKSNYKGSVVFVDSGSSDQTVSIIESYKFPGGIIPKTLRFKENIGIAEGNNVGINWALRKKVDAVILINNDVEIEPNSLTGLARESIERNAATVPLMFYGDDKSKLWYGSGSYSRSRATGFHKQTLPNQDHTQVTYAPTCCMALPSFVFRNGIKMDKMFFMYFDDTDFCMQLHQAKVPIYVCSEYRLYHHVSSSSGGRRSPITVYYYTRNYLYFAKKYAKGISYLTFWIWFIATRSYRLLGFIAHRQVKQARCLVKGIQDYFNGRMGRQDII